MSRHRRPARIDVELYLVLLTVALTLESVDSLPIGGWEWPLALVAISFIATIAVLGWREIRRW